MEKYIEYIIIDIDDLCEEFKWVEVFGYVVDECEYNKDVCCFVVLVCDNCGVVVVFVGVIVFVVIFFKL